MIRALKRAARWLWPARRPGRMTLQDFANHMALAALVVAITMYGVLVLAYEAQQNDPANICQPIESPFCQKLINERPGARP